MAQTLSGRQHEARDGEVAIAASPAALRADLRRRGGLGAGLSFTLRQRLHNALGFDPEAARLHRNPAAAGAARRLKAAAFTIGSDIYFGDDHGDIESGRGLALLAHELTHVGQQARLGSLQMRFWTPAGGDAMEQEAQQVARRVQEDAGPASSEASSAGHDGANPRRSSTSPRPSLSFTLPTPTHTPDGPPVQSQSSAAGRQQTGGASQSSGRGSAGAADARAVADRVYELMRQEIVSVRRRGLGL